MVEETPEQTEIEPAPEAEAVEASAQTEQSNALEPEPASEAGAQPEDGPGEMTQEELEQARANEVAFSWQASEYVHHHKGASWYAALLGGVGVLVGAAALLHYWLPIGAFLAMGVAILVYARKPPRTLMYELTPKGITIEGKAYPFAEFRSFGVLNEEEFHSIDLEPVKRFSPRITVLFDSDDFDSIVGHLELHLPRTDREPDVIERASKYLRF
jgi:hypothetical protein